jgi:formylglycine-generating enzyme required for sulfatase activity
MKTMPFNFDQWKECAKQNLQGWKVRMDRAGVNSAYYLITASAFLPIVEAAHKGDWSALAVLGSAVGTNLLANIVQKVKDKSDVELARILEDEVRRTPELKAEMDAMLQKLDTLQEAEKALSEADKAWFAETIQRELKSLNSGIKYEATVIGGGAIAQGTNAKAVGAGGILIEGGVSGNGVTIGSGNKVTYIKKQVIESSRPDPEAERRRKAFEKYLNRLSRVCLSLPLAALGGGDGDESEVTLDKVYIALNTTEQRRVEVEIKDEKEFKEYWDRNEFIVRDELIPALESVTAHKKLTLLGDPGAGKSTFVKNLLAWQAGALLGKLQPPEGIDSNLIPALVILRDLAPRLAKLDIDSLPAKQHDEKLAGAIWEQMQADLGDECTEFNAGLREALESGTCLLVLDGLDEVPHELRVRVRQAVDALLKQYHLKHIVITCRVRSYVGEIVLPSFESRTLAPFNEEQIKHFVAHWYKTQRSLGKFNEEQSASRRDDLTQAALEADMRELSSNPMLLTTMAIIHQREVGLPRERVRLYHLAVEVLLRRWQKHKAGDAALAEFLKNDLKLRGVMESLAYEAHRASAETGGTGTLLRKDALDLLEKAEQLGDIRLAAEFLDYVDQRAGLLVGYGGELTKPTAYSFPHRTFQEYLAGAYLARQRDRVRTFYEHAAEGDSWDLAAQLAFEELYYNRRNENELLDLAYQLNQPNGQSEQCQRARLWAGQIITLVGRDATERDTHPNGGAKYLEKLLPGLVELLASDYLPPLERAEAGRALAKLGDPRPEVMTVETMQFCHIPAGEFMMGEGEKQQHTLTLPEFWMSRYPVTNAQFNQFVEAGGYAEEHFWAEARKEGFWKDGGFKGRYDNEFRTAPANFAEPYYFANHPVVGVVWYEALAFTRWMTGELRVKGYKLWVYKPDTHAVHEDETLKSSIVNLKSEIAMPSEAEWEKAAHRGDGGQYPWEGEFDRNKANTSETGIGSTSAVGCFTGGVSPYGLQDMSGNVWEWTRTNYDTKKDGLESKDTCVLRGGSFNYESSFARCACRYGGYPVYGGGNLGFRVAVVSPVLPSRL